MPSREIPEEVVGRSKAVVSTTAVAGAVALVVFAGAVAPADLAGADVAAVSGSKFPAVAEAYSSAVDAVCVPLVIQTGGRQRAVIRAGPVWPVEKTGDLMDEVTVPEPLEHSVVGVPNGVGGGTQDIMTVLEPIEHSVVEMPKALGKDSGDVVTVLEPIEHSVLVRGFHDV